MIVVFKCNKNENKKILESKRLIHEAQEKIRIEKLNIKKSKREEFRKTKFFKFIKKTFRFINFDKDTYSFPEVLTVTVLSLLIGAFSCFSVFTIIFGGSNYLKLSKELSKIAEVYDIITEKYKGDIDKKALTDSAIKGMIGSIGDEYTGYYDEESKNEFNSNVNGEYEGIGCSIMLSEDKMIVVEVFDDSPADKAGLKTNDVIVSVDGESTKGLSLDEVSNYIKTKDSTKVEMVVLRNEKEIKLKLTRGKVETPVVTSKTYEVNGKKVGYLGISIFSSSASNQFESKLKKLEKEGIDSLIIDVRGNSGGYLSSVTKIANTLLPIGKTIYQIGTENKKTSYKDKSFEKRTYPIAVLVNGSSASASEILAAAIKESYNGYVVGTPTYGKGTVQQTMPLSDGSMLKVTVEDWLTPDGNYVDNVGVMPTHQVSLEDIYYENPVEENDTQLQKALELVSEIGV